MQSVAQEMNLAETAFLVGDGDGYRLRWFTPSVEVDLCGHATLASAHILWEAGHLAAGKQATFMSKSGLLIAELKADLIELNFPALVERQTTLPAGILEGLGTTPTYTGKNPLDYLVEVESESVVRNLKPNFDLLAKAGARGVIVTSRSTTKGFDFISRFVAPGAGIDEDPVTGSSHCCLGPYWQSKLKKDSLVGYQASPRGGIVSVRVEGERVILGGKARTFFKGEMV
jgi:predicted PhzF superfamily epimerase YddE/YHI9